MRRAAPMMACPASAPARSAARCVRPGTAGRGGGAGARPAWSCAGASTKARSPSPIRTPGKKGADRASLHARRRPRPGGLVRGRGRPVPGRAAAGRQLATARPPGDPAARVCPGWHLQGPDPVPSRDGTGAPPAGQQLHQPDPAWLAQGAARGDPGGAAGTRCAARCGSAPRRVGGLAGRPGGALHLARRAAAPAHAPGVGQPGRPQDGRDGGLAVPARHHAALHPARRQLAEHGRVHPAHPETAHARRPASAEPGRDRRLVSADRRGLEPATHALPVERQAPAEATEAARRRTRTRRLGRSHAEAALAARPQLTGMAQSEASDPLVDSLPVPACRFARAHRCRSLRGFAAFGYDALAHQTFYGLRLRVAWPGVITAAVLAPASEADRAVAPQLLAGLTGWALGDKGYWSPSLRAELAPGRLDPIAPRRGKGSGTSRWPAWLVRTRRR